MTELLPLSIGIGLAATLLFSELFGLIAGGMIVPGYLALYLNQPLRVLATFLVAALTVLLVRAIAKFSLLYGRRRMVLTLLLGYVIVGLARSSGARLGFVGGADAEVIGYVVPGLIAIWLDRQGVVQTLSALLTTASVVRLVLVLLGALELSE